MATWFLKAEDLGAAPKEALQVDDFSGISVQFLKFAACSGNDSHAADWMPDFGFVQVDYLIAFLCCTYVCCSVFACLFDLCWGTLNRTSFETQKRTANLP